MVKFAKIKSIGIATLIVSLLTGQDLAARGDNDGVGVLPKEAPSLSGGQYLAPADADLGTATTPLTPPPVSSGASYACFDLLSVEGEWETRCGWLWNYIVDVLEGAPANAVGTEACFWLIYEASLMRSFYEEQGWSGYPRMSCGAPTDNMFSVDALPGITAVACSPLNYPAALPMITDLRTDVKSTRTLRRLCKAYHGE